MVCYFTKGRGGLPTCSLRLRTTHKYTGMGASSIVDVSCYFTIGPGQQRHWLSFSRPDLYEPHFRPKFEYRLGAAEFISIVNGLGDDMREYATQVQADEQEIAPLFAQIDAFVENMKT